MTGKQENFRFSKKTEPPEIGESRALDANGGVVRGDRAGPGNRLNSAKVAFEYDSASKHARVSMQVDVGNPLTISGLLTSDIEWDLDLSIGRSGYGSFTFRSKRFASYAVYSTADGATRLLHWQDASIVSPTDALDIGWRLAN